MRLLWPLKARRHRGTGTVYLAWHPDDLKYWGYWDGKPDGPNAALEQCPKSRSARKVIKWGQARAPRIWIRPRHDHGHYYWAGAGDLPDDLREHPRYEPDH
jgi:hypothetical protein